MARMGARLCQLSLHYPGGERHPFVVTSFGRTRPLIVPWNTRPSVNERAIACALLSGPNFQPDARRVHQLLKSFLQSETAKQWIKPIARRQSGREHMIALSNHLSRKGNKSRRIAQAEGYRDLLYYKHKKSLSFSNFLDKIQKMLL